MADETSRHSIYKGLTEALAKIHKELEGVKKDLVTNGDLTKEMKIRFEFVLKDVEAVKKAVPTLEEKLKARLVAVAENSKKQDEKHEKALADVVSRLDKLEQARTSESSGQNKLVTVGQAVIGLLALVVAAYAALKAK